jgi:putative DNA primase/helicase
MRQDFFEFFPQFKLFVAGNHKPAIRNIDEAMKRRLHLIPFTITVPPERRDKNLQQKLLAERDGILAWAVQGCLDWQRHDGSIRRSVVSATEEYFEAEDALGRWLDERCVREANAKSLTAELFNDWKQWAERPASSSVAEALLRSAAHPWREMAQRHGRARVPGIGLKHPPTPAYTPTPMTDPTDRLTDLTRRNSYTRARAPHGSFDRTRPIRQTSQTRTDTMTTTILALDLGTTTGWRCAAATATSPAARELPAAALRRRRNALPALQALAHRDQAILRRHRLPALRGGAPPRLDRCGARLRRFRHAHRVVRAPPDPVPGRAGRHDQEARDRQGQRGQGRDDPPCRVATPADDNEADALALLHWAIADDRRCDMKVPTPNTAAPGSSAARDRIWTRSSNAAGATSTSSWSTPPTNAGLHRARVRAAHRRRSTDRRARHG